MVTLIIEGTIRNDDIGRRMPMRMQVMPLRFFPPLLLRPHYDQRQLTSRLPSLILLRYLLRIRRQVPPPLIIPRFGTLNMPPIHLMLAIPPLMPRRLLLLTFMHHPAPRQDVKPSLSLSYQLPILMLLQTYILLFDHLVIHLTLIHRLRMQIVKSLRTQ